MDQDTRFSPDKEPLGKRSPVGHVNASHVGYGSVGSPTKAPSEPRVIAVEDAVPEIAALLHVQWAVQESSKTVFGQS